jgi:hypothetical protein
MFQVAYFNTANYAKRDMFKFRQIKFLILLAVTNIPPDGALPH